MNREDTIKFLVTNCDCWKGDEKLLNTFTDEKLKLLAAKFNQSKKDETVANQVRKGLIVGNAKFNFDENSGRFVSNAKKHADFDGTQAEWDDLSEKEQMEYEGGEEEVENEEVENAGRTVNKQQSLREWEASMPSEAREIWQAVKNVEKREKAALIVKLTANVSPKKRQIVANKLAKKKLPELNEMLELLPPTEIRNKNNDSEEDVNEGDFMPTLFSVGAGGPDTVLNGESDVDDDDGPLPPVYNWDSMSNKKDVG